MLALVIGTVLAVLALAFVLVPLFVYTAPRSVRNSPDDSQVPDDPVAALREIEFDRATGKLSDADYATLKTRFTERALAAMRAERAAATSSNATALDPAEAAIQRARRRPRTCAQCGPRPEPDALYCSTCGRYLASRCAHCGADIAGTGARYCATCGSRLAA
jgi:hypothetical protein